MDMHEAAAAMNGNEYREEGSRELFAEMRKAGLVAVYGASDDLTEFDGTIRDEVGAYNGADHVLTQTGPLYSRCDEGEACPYFKEKVTALSPNIHARWDTDGYAWKIETDLPHATFDILEGGEPYCRGVVISKADLPA